MMQVLNQSYLSWSERFAALQRRERILLAALTVCLLLLPVYTWLLEPVIQQQQQLEQQLEQQRRVFDQTQQALTGLQSGDGQSQQPQGAEQLLQLQQLQAELVAQLQEQTVDLIPAERMGDVLERLLSSARGIRLLQMRSLAPAPLLDMGGTDSQLSGNLYQHGIELTFSGRYFDVLQFLQAAEQLPWRFYWEEMDYQVQKFPRGEVRVVLYTLSTSDKFIGV